MLADLVRESRSTRRFDESQRVPHEVLVDLVNTTRLTASSCNGQVLKFKIFSTPEDCEQVFPTIKWAGALPDWDGPEPGQRPTGYIVILRDESLVINDRFTCWDEGIVAQTLMLAARDAGFGGCMIGAFAKGTIARLCEVEDTALVPDLVFALGTPAEDIRLVAPGPDGSITYYRDADGVHYVPKRPLSEVLL